MREEYTEESERVNTIKIYFGRNEKDENSDNGRW